MECIVQEKINKFGAVLKDVRLDEGLTQKQVAEKLGVKHQSYQAYEAGIAVPTLENLIKLCEVFGITPNDFLSYK